MILFKKRYLIWMVAAIVGLIFAFAPRSLNGSNYNDRLCFANGPTTISAQLYFNNYGIPFVDKTTAWLGCNDKKTTISSSKMVIDFVIGILVVAGPFELTYWYKGRKIAGR